MIFIQYVFAMFIATFQFDTAFAITMSVIALLVAIIGVAVIERLFHTKRN
jgi:hypothetical protein